MWRKKAFDNVQNREMKSESGFSLAMASQPFKPIFQLYYHKQCIPATRATGDGMTKVMP